MLKLKRLWALFIRKRSERYQRKLNRGGGWIFDWPSVRSISVPMGPNSTKSVITRDRLIRISWWVTSKYIEIGPYRCCFWFRWRKVKFRREEKCWENCVVWAFVTPLFYVSYHPRWVYEASEVYAQGKREALEFASRRVREAAA